MEVAGGDCGVGVGVIVPGLGPGGVVELGEVGLATNCSCLWNKAGG